MQRSSCVGSKRTIPNGQAVPILLARIANQSTGFPFAFPKGAASEMITCSYYLVGGPDG